MDDCVLNSYYIKKSVRLSHDSLLALESDVIQSMTNSGKLQFIIFLLGYRKMIYVLLKEGNWSLIFFQDKYESLSEEFHDFQVSSKEIEQVQHPFLHIDFVRSYLYQLVLSFTDSTWCNSVGCFQYDCVAFGRNHSFPFSIFDLHLVLIVQYPYRTPPVLTDARQWSGSGGAGEREGREGEGRCEERCR